VIEPLARFEDGVADAREKVAEQIKQTLARPGEPSRRRNLRLLLGFEKELLRLIEDPITRSGTSRCGILHAPTTNATTTQ